MILFEEHPYAESTIRGILSAPEVSDFIAGEARSNGFSASSWGNKLATRGSIIYSMEDGEVHGFAILYMHGSPDKGMYIAVGFVNQHIRSRGIYQKIMREIFVRAREKGFEWVWAYISTRNARSVRFHERMGFDFVEVVEKPSGSLHVIRYNL
ncbi:MAG: hypothetical protein CSA97_01275 [Bacteroidetes bacterium]|nr:MAG: hypothetical protein CSA97_01275 [Bacteroidota bacterium]